MSQRSRLVAHICALQREAVARKGVARLLCDKLLKNFAARLLGLGHGSEPAYYNGLNEVRQGRIAAALCSRFRKEPGMPKMGRNKVQSRTKGGSATAPAKPVSASRSELTEAVLPNDANILGKMLGGRVMHLIDIAGALAAGRHSNSFVVTASVDYLDFRFPIAVGEFIVLKASVNRVFHTSMEVGVKVYAENILTGERRHTSSAYVTYVALDMNLQPHAAPPLVPETEEDERRYREAGERRRLRLATRHKGILPLK